MPSSEPGTEKIPPYEPGALLAWATRNVEANTLELGEVVAWCLELEWIGVRVASDLYRR
jgi:hypothetical protein